VIVERIETRVVELPLPRPVTNAAGVAVETLGIVLVTLEAGARGESFVYTMRARHTGAVRSMIDSLGALVIGEDAAEPERIWQKLWKEIYFFGYAGVSVMAISALDTALWDAHAKVEGQPLARLLGQRHDALPAYASQGLWTDAGPDALAREAEALAAEGWRAMKLRLGRRDAAEDVARVRAVREAVGDGIVLMADASRAFTAEHAIELGRRLEPYGLDWFEEPLPAHDLAGIARVRAALGTRIAIGENDYARTGFRAILDAGAADVWMLDLARVGGISELRRVAELAAAHDVPVSNHVYAEHSIGALATLPNCPIAEYIDWFEPLLEQRLELRDGALVVPDRPGLGFTFDEAAIGRLRTLA
jgi:L-alanine-DL-glutamate epimerase-like enolase superfamily enzyme